MKFIKYYIFIFMLINAKPCFPQYNYNISTNGYNFEELDGKNIIVKIYLNAYNIGALSKWNDDIRDFKLYSERNQEYYKLSSYMPLFDIENSGTNPVYFYLSYAVPKEAGQIVLKFPDRYGGLKTSIYQNSYNYQQTSQTSKGSDGLTKYFGYYIAIPFQIKSINSNGNSINSLGIGIGILPKIITFGKTNNTILFADLKAEFNFALNWKSDSFNKLYNLDKANYQVSESFKDSSTSNNYIYSLGLGIYQKLGSVNPMLSISAAYINNIYYDLTVHDLKNEKRFDPSYRAWGVRVDFGISIKSILYLGYSFGSFSPKTNVDILNQSVIINSIQIGVKGFIF